MPLLRNTGQPYFPDPNSPNQYGCNGDYCYPVVAGDVLMQQWYQTPCGNNDLIDPTFNDYTLGAELITDGDFGPGPALPASWTESLAGSFIWTASGAEFQNAFGHGSNIEQSGLGIVAGSLYEFSMDVTGLSTGDYIEVYIGGTSPFCIINANGTFTTRSLAGSDNTNITIVSESDNDFTIDAVSLKLVTVNQWDLNGQWQVDGGYACKEQTGTGDLEETVANYITAGGYYSLTFTVTGYQAGTLTPYVSTDAGTAVSADGTYTQYFEPAVTGVVKFTPSAAFIGCISGLDLRELRNDYQMTIIGPDMLDGDVYDISDSLEYYEDKVTLAFDPQDEELPYGCYVFRLYDSCLTEGNDLVTNGTFAAGDTGWDRRAVSDQYNIGAGACQFIFNPLENGDILTNGDFSAGSAGWTVGAGWTVVNDAVHTPGSTAALSRSVTIGTPATPPAFKLWWVQLTVSGRTAGSFTVSLGTATSSAYSLDGTFCFSLAPTVGGVVTFSINPSTTFDGTIDDISLYEVTTSWVRVVQLNNAANADIVAGNYQMTFDITNITATGTVGVAGAVAGMTQSLTYETTVATHTVSIPSYTPGSQIPYLSAQFRENDPAGGVRSYVGSITVDNVELVRVEPFEATYQSECINYQVSHDRTKLIDAYSDQEALGFEYTNTGFRLRQRVWCRAIAPTYKRQTNIAEFGTGDSAVKYGEVTKAWQFHTAPMSESAHDCLALQISSDHFAIGDSVADAIEYTAQPDDYTPNWNGSGSYDLATGTLELRLKDGGQLYNRHT